LTFEKQSFASFIFDLPPTVLGERGLPIQTQSSVVVLVLISKVNIELTEKDGTIGITRERVRSICGGF
jgi:hypothetical protein